MTVRDKDQSLHLPAFAPFPRMLVKAFFFSESLESRLCNEVLKFGVFFVFLHNPNF